MLNTEDEGTLCLHAHSEIWDHMGYPGLPILKADVQENQWEPLSGEYKRCL